MKIIFCLLIFILHYLEYLWKSFDQPLIHLSIEQCQQTSIDTIRSFLFEQYKKFLAFISNNEKECQVYQINLHLPILFFLLKCSSISYIFIHLFKILAWCYTLSSLYILRKQIQPFIHIRSIALISPKTSSDVLRGKKKLPYLLHNLETTDK